MPEPRASLFDVVVGALHDYGVDRAITSQSLLCAELEVCDDDLSDLVEELFNRLQLVVPDEPTILPVSEPELRVEDLVKFPAGWGGRTGST